MIFAKTQELFDFHSSSPLSEFDKHRLSNMLFDIHMLFKKNGWLTVEEISDQLHLKNQSSISAQIRNLRKHPFNLKIERRNRNGIAGFSEYRLRA